MGRGGGGDFEVTALPHDIFSMYGGCRRGMEGGLFTCAWILNSLLLLSLHPLPSLPLPISTPTVSHSPSLPSTAHSISICFVLRFLRHFSLIIPVPSLLTCFSPSSYSLSQFSASLPPSLIPPRKARKDPISVLPAERTAESQAKIDTSGM